MKQKSSVWKGNESLVCLHGQQVHLFLFYFSCLLYLFIVNIFVLFWFFFFFDGLALIFQAGGLYMAKFKILTCRLTN